MPTALLCSIDNERCSFADLGDAVWKASQPTNECPLRRYPSFRATVPSNQVTQLTNPLTVMPCHASDVAGLSCHVLQLLPLVVSRLSIRPAARKSELARVGEVSLFHGPWACLLATACYPRYLTTAWPRQGMVDTVCRSVGRVQGTQARRHDVTVVRLG
jgi:hypothetical protein